MNCVLQCLSNTKPLKEYILALNLEKIQLDLVIPAIIMNLYLLLKELWLIRKRYASMFPNSIRDAVVSHFSQFRNANMHDAHEFLFTLLDYFDFELSSIEKKLREGNGDNNQNNESKNIEEKMVNEFDNEVINNKNNNKEEVNDKVKDKEKDENEEKNKRENNNNNNNDFFLLSNDIDDKEKEKGNNDIMKKENVEPNYNYINEVFQKNKINDSIPIPNSIVIPKPKQIEAKIENSIISKLFYGKLQSFIRCKICQETTYNYELFNCISLPIPKEKKHIVYYFFSLDHNKDPESYSIDIFNESKIKNLKDKIIAKHAESLVYNLIEAINYKIKYNTIEHIDNDAFIWQSFNKTSTIVFYEKQNEAEKGIYFNYLINNTQSDILRIGIKDQMASMTNLLMTIKEITGQKIKRELTTALICIVHNTNTICFFCRQSIPHQCKIDEGNNSIASYLSKALNKCLYLSISYSDNTVDISNLPGTFLQTVKVYQNEDISLTNCFNFFNSYEDITGWKCPNCNKVRDAEKAIQIHTPPKYLILQLNRFKFQTGFMKYFKNKNHTLVQFPVSSLDIQDHVVNKDNLQMYDLYGVINHLSWFSGFGHYIAFCKNENNWVRYNDTKVDLINESDIVSNNAYLLFYEMKNK